MKYIKYILIFFVCMGFGLGLRQTNLDRRVPHADESEQAHTFSKLYDGHGYKYNPNGPHGPVLYYWTYAYEKLRGYFPDSAQMRISDLRKSVFPFMWLECALIALASGAGVAAGLAGAGWLWLSSTDAIYSVYFVHETIFAFFVTAFAVCVLRFIRSGFGVKWAVLAGIAAGLAQSTKETFFIYALAVVLAGSAILLIEKACSKEAIFNAKKASLSLAGFVVAAAAVCAALYSAFGTNPRGIADAFLSYIHFAGKAGGSQIAEDPLFYFKLLFVQKSFGAYFGEISITLASIVGAAAAAFNIKNALQKKLLPSPRATAALFFFMSAAFATLGLSAIPYKTPWLMLSNVCMLCVAGGYGTARLLATRNVFVHILSLAAIAGAFFLQYRLSSNAAILYNSDPRNPFIYTHTVRDYMRLIDRIKACAKYSGHANAMPAAFITTQSPWPAPWELRNYKNIGFWLNSKPQDLSQFDAIVSDPYTDAFVAAELEKLAERKHIKYASNFFGARKNLIFTLYIKEPIYDKLISE